jgi:hypothetical protein
MIEPVRIPRHAPALTAKGSFYVQILRLRESFNELPDQDRLEALELMGDLLRSSVKLERQRTA